jgi:nucleotide-binding universal stress UspA family protein
MEGIMKEISHIVVPVDIEEHTQKLLEYANYIAGKLAAKLHIIHVIEPFPTTGDMELGLNTIQEYTENRIQHAKEFLQKLTASYPESTTTILQGIVVDEIVKFAKGKNSDIIIIGTHGTKGIEHLFLGSVAERVVKGAHCPTLVMNPFKS